MVIKNNFITLTNIFQILFSVLPRSIRIILLQHFRKTLGKKGFILRSSLIKTLAKECGDNVFIFPDVYLLNVDKLVLGNNISIHPMSYIDASGEIDIGDNVSIAHGTTLLSTSHRYEDLKVPIRNQGIVKKKTIIKGNVWIGAKVTILCGITIEAGSILAANSVITKDVDENSIVGGSPAKFLKAREVI